MKNIVLKFGAISGGISAALMFLTFVLLRGPWLEEHGYLVGYAGMVLSFSVIFVGVRNYREQVGEGYVSFGKAFQMGLLIALISSVCYAVTWVIVNRYFYPNFWDDYIQHQITKLRDSGAAQAAIDRSLKQMEEYKTMTANPLVNGLMAFIEPLPVGLIVSLISAAILKKKPAATA